MSEKNESLSGNACIKYAFRQKKDPEIFIRRCSGQMAVIEGV